MLYCSFMATKKIEDILKETKIYQILRPKLVTATPTVTLRQAITQMQHEKAGYVVIADEHLKIHGLFTERDVLMKVLCAGVSLDEPVTQYMHAVPAMSKKDSVWDALKAMHNHSIRHIPLVDELGKMNGVLSIRTIVTFMAELLPVEVFNLPPKPDQIHDTVEGG